METFSVVSVQLTVFLRKALKDMFSAYISPVKPRAWMDEGLFLCKLRERFSKGRSLYQEQVPAFKSSLGQFL